MLDASLPCTVFEYDEWGNPSDQEKYQYMKSYCPYINITEQEYPHILIRSGEPHFPCPGPSDTQIVSYSFYAIGMNDARVGFWESLKYAAKLRARKMDNNLLLLNLVDAGHGGHAGGQYGVFEVWRLGCYVLVHV